MKEIALHILDIVQNSIHAQANRIEIILNEMPSLNIFEFEITDNGFGMNAEQLNGVLNPFYTTKHKKTGLGIPLLKQHAEMTGGYLNIHSEAGKGTTVKASFEYHHFDRQPIGNIATTLTGIIRANPSVHIVYSHCFENNKFVLDTEVFKAELGGIPINNSDVIHFVEQFITENLEAIQLT